MDKSVTKPLPLNLPIWLASARGTCIVLLMNTATAAHTAAQTVAAALAGSDYRWTHADAPKQLDSKHRRGLTLLLLAAQGNVCAACGDFADGAMELCHLTASRVSGRGIMPGNVYVGHKGCNDDDNKVYGDIVPLSSLVRGDIVPVSFPTRQACHVAADEADAVRAARRARRAG